MNCHLCGSSLWGSYGEAPTGEKVCRSCIYELACDVGLITDEDDGAVQLLAAYESLTKEKQ